MSRAFESPARVIHDFFPPEIVTEIVNYLDARGIRKEEFNLLRPASNEVPDSIEAAWKFATIESRLTFNLAIVKRYRIDDTYESGAYAVHQDPPNRIGIPLFLCTLKGVADFTYWLNDATSETIRCTDNTVILLGDPSLPHRITPPLGEDGQRDFLFLGYDTDLSA